MLEFTSVPSRSNTNFDMANTTLTDLDYTNTTNQSLRQPPIHHLNVSNIFPLDFAIPMFGYLMPILFFLTVSTNSLVVIVLAKKHMRSATNSILMAMALSDMFTVLFPAPWLFYLFTLGHYVQPLSPVALCYAFIYMHEVIPALFHTAAIWLTLGLALQRYIAICHPTTAITWCSMPRVIKGIYLIYGLALLHQSTRFVDRIYTSVEIRVGEEMVTVCRESTAFWVSVISENIYYNIYYWFRVVFVHVVPCTALVVLNWLLYKTMRDASNKRAKLLQAGKQRDCRRSRESNCTTLMLIIVVTLFLCVEIPLAVITLLHIIQSSFNVPVLEYYIANMLILCTNFCIIASHPINFAIYCGMSHAFRETFKGLFIKPHPSPREGSSRYSAINGPRTCTNESGI